MPRWTRTILLTAAAVLGLLYAARGIQSPAVAAEPTFVPTEGPVQGAVKNGISEFLGIPYAAPPVGDLRWQPPQAPRGLDADAERDEVRPYLSADHRARRVRRPGEPDGGLSLPERLHPHANPPPNAKKLPVLLWIHGGGLFDGESNDYDASALVKGGPAGPTVVVTINYRLGLLGYFGHPALDAEGHDFGNYGLMDQQEALRWVQRNIAAFGGDPGNVTVGGQSAGSTSTAALVISPASAGLLHRAIFESGPLLTVAPLSLAEKRGSNFAKAAGCDIETNEAVAACLRALSVSKILSLQGTAAANGPYVNGLLVDGTVLPIPGGYRMDAPANSTTCRS